MIFAEDVFSPDLDNFLLLVNSASPLLALLLLEHVELLQAGVETGAAQVAVLACTALEPQSPDRLCVAYVALVVLMQDVFISGILNNVEGVLEGGILALDFLLRGVCLLEALLAQVVVTYCLALVVPVARCYVLVADVTVDDILPVDIVFSELVTQGEPALTQVVVPGKKLYLFSAWHQQIYQCVDLIRFLGLLADLSDD